MPDPSSESAPPTSFPQASVCPAPHVDPGGNTLACGGGVGEQIHKFKRPAMDFGTLYTLCLYAKNMIPPVSYFTIRVHSGDFFLCMNNNPCFVPQWLVPAALKWRSCLCTVWTSTVRTTTSRWEDEHPSLLWIRDPDRKGTIRIRILLSDPSWSGNQANYIICNF